VPTLNRLLLGVLVAEILILGFGVRNWSGGDVGVYIAVAYQTVQHRLPYVDFAWAQGPALPYLMAPVIRLAGPSVLAMSAFTTAFSLLTLWLSLGLMRRVLAANRVVDEQGGVAALLTTLICSPFVWWFMAGVDTKSSVAVLLLLGGVVCAARAVQGTRPAAWAALAGLLVGTLVASKYTFASVVPCFVVYVWYYGRGRRLPLVTGGAAGLAVGSLIWFVPVVQAVGLRASLDLILDNFRFMALDYAMRGTTVRQGLFDSGAVMTKMLALTAGLVPCLLVFAVQPIQWRRLLRLENSVLVLSSACGFVYLVSHWVALFPNVWFDHYPVIYFFVALPVVIWANVVLGEAGEAWRLSPRRLVALGLCAAVPQISLALGHAMVPMRPFSTAYAYEILGRNPMVEALNRLADEGLPSGERATPYLYVGRAMASLLPSRLPMSVWSAEGNNYMDNYDVDRATANRLKLLVLSNFGDLLQTHNTVVLAHQYLSGAERSREQLLRMREALATAGFEPRQADDRNELYVKR